MVLLWNVFNKGAKDKRKVWGCRRGTVTPCRFWHCGLTLCFPRYTDGAFIPEFWCCHMLHTLSQITLYLYPLPAFTKPKTLSDGSLERAHSRVGHREHNIRRVPWEKGAAVVLARTPRGHLVCPLVPLSPTEEGTTNRWVGPKRVL